MSIIRYPAVPLITVDPNFSIWSMADRLYDDVTRHWTKRRNNLIGYIKADGRPLRFMGKADHDLLLGKDMDVIPQKSVRVYPMRTVYEFENDICSLELNFTSPLLTDDLLLLSRPVSYISYKVEFTDGKEHEFGIYFGMSAEIAADDPEDTVTVRTYEHGACAGKGETDMLTESGDNMCIDWGFVHIFGNESFTSSVKDGYGMFVDSGCFCSEIKKILRRNRLEGDSFKVKDKYAYIGVESSSLENFLCVAYDDIHSIRYFGKNIDAYYKKDGDTFEDVCKKALSEYGDIVKRVAEREAGILSAAGKISEQYAELISLAYRQAIAAHKLTWDGEELQFFSKECFSNGCIATLDVTYPSFPMFLYFNPDLAEGMLNPLFKFARSDGWKFDFAPHDVGQYPIADGQVYGLEDGELKYDMQMPLEECGNAILCVYQICRYRNDFSYAEKHFDLLSKWCEYLTEYGSDPDLQLCTDDFAGHLAHNCNLSLKAIMGIAAFAKILEGLSKSGAEEYFNKAKEMAEDWEKRADAGDHYKLSFDGEDTWSLKYNLVWDKIFGWNVFDSEVADKEVAYYKKQMKRYGVPLDSRKDYTKTDWLIWTTCLNDDNEYRDAVIDSIINMLNETPSRVPFTDWYYASTAVQVGFQNRTVLGGAFINFLK